MSNDQEPTGPDEQPRARRWLSNKRSRRMVIAGTTAALCAAIGLAVGLDPSPSGTAAQNVTAYGPTTTTTAGVPARGPRSGGGTPNARSAPAAGGAAGTVSNVSTSSFTLTTPAGKQVTVNEGPTTTYDDRTGPTPGAVATDDTVLVLGTTDGTTITATRVIEHPAGDYGAAASSAAGVVPFQQGAPSAAKQVGQVPANYTEGSGTVVSGTAADQATEAALAAYPGGIVDRVVQLSDGEYEVHNIGVNWPHHVFVSQDFEVVGAN